MSKNKLKIEFAKLLKKAKNKKNYLHWKNGRELCNTKIDK